MRIPFTNLEILKSSTQERDSFTVKVDVVKEFEEQLKKWSWARNTLVNTLGCAAPPVDPFVLDALTDCNGYHSNALYLKTSATVGQGYTCSDALRAHIEYVNGDQTFEDFAEENQLDLETYGDMYVETRRNAKTASFYRSPALLTRIKPIANDSIKFIQFEYKMKSAMGGTEFEPFKRGMVTGMSHLRLARKGGSRYYGSPEYFSIKKHLTLNLSITTLAEKWFENAMQIDKLFILKGGTLTPDQKATLRAFMSKTLKGVDNASKAILLELARQAELEVKDLGGNVKEASFTELRKDNVHEIGAGHRTPSKLLGSPSGAQLGASNEIDGLIRLFTITFVNGRQRKVQAFYRRLFRDAGLPDADTFTLNQIDTSAGEVDAQTLATATGGQAWMTPGEARDEWFNEKGFNAEGAAAFMSFLKQIDNARKNL